MVEVLPVPTLALEYKAWEGKGKREEERKLCTWEKDSNGRR